MQAVASKRGYLPTLDGWRAIAILCVIFYHDRLHQWGKLSDAPIKHFGFFGVDVFFAISGLLICSRLMEEEQVCGSISLKNFYIRRFCRILPAAICFLIVLALLNFCGLIRVDLGSWLSALLFYSNYYQIYARSLHPTFYTAHFWSLSVEEHFYLLLPLICVAFPKNRARILTALVILAITYSLIVHASPQLLQRLGGDIAEIRTDLHIANLLFPALIAMLLMNEPFRAWCIRWIKPIIIVPAIVVVWILFHEFAHTLVVQLLVPLGFPLLILSTTLNPQTLLGRFLELQPFKFVGKISYSLYLWQQLFLVEAPLPHKIAWILDSPWNIAVTTVMALASYYVIERPFIRLGHRLAPPASQGRPA